MAKKNSSKTATEKAIQSSEPRVMTFKGWQGVNFVDAPLTWNPLENQRDSFRQTDLPANYLMVQNNLVTTDTMALETRQDSIVIGEAYSDSSFTGVSAIYKHWLFCVMRQKSDSIWFDRVCYRDLLDEQGSEWKWTNLDIYIRGSKNNPSVEITEIGFFESNMVVMARDSASPEHSGILLLGRVETPSDDSSISIYGIDWGAGQIEIKNMISETPKICPETNAPQVKPVITPQGLAAGDVRVNVMFCYTNRLGSTLASEVAQVMVEVSPALWTTEKYVTITPAEGDPSVATSATGIDFYGRDTENLDWVFIGHLNVSPGQIADGNWAYHWYGNMTDITQWVTSQLMVPTDNTTHGPDATHFSYHDSHMYYWGMPSKPYRLWIGGNPGSEFSVARGLGGAWVDIEPGSGFEVQGTEKWKTVSGANIVTIMCGNRNTTKIKRFNLVETNLTLTNEVSYKSYMYEEVSNVVGCNSRWGHGVFSDGLYSLNRYGLMLTTMAMEYNSQMKNQKMSDVIDPIFTERIGKRLRDGRMICIDDVIYIVLSEEKNEESEEPIGLDNVILCYDMNLKAWYTWTHDETLDAEKGSDPDHLLHVLAIDSDEFVEGLAAITEKQVRLYPVTGVQEPTVPNFQVLMETGELTPRLPMQAFWYLQQLELRFDYFIGDPDNPATMLIEGVDYYGRYFAIEKKLNKPSRTWHPSNDSSASSERRNYIEWIRIDKIVESFRVRIKGKARFRLTHINAKLYQQADNIGTPYGFDASDTGYTKNHPDGFKIHHYIDDYNNLRRAVIS